MGKNLGMITTPLRACTKKFSCPDSAKVRSPLVDALSALFAAYLG
jgi:hypothetical protein